MSKRLIAISGWRGSGKDTAADYLVAEYGYTKMSLAKLLKDLVSEQYNIPRNYMDDRVLKEAPLPNYPVIPGDSFSARIQSMLATELTSGYWTPRALCILEGSIKRSVYSNYWTRYVISRMDPNKKYVISDLRYKTEADTFRMLLPKEELLLLRINRFDSIDTNDPSERDLDDYSFDCYIHQNIQTIPDLYQALRFLVGSQQ
jgi:hypothetical protein